MKKTIIAAFDLLPGQMMAFDYSFPFIVHLQNNSNDGYKVVMRKRSFCFQKIRVPKSKLKLELRSPLPDWED